MDEASGCERAGVKAWVGGVCRCGGVKEWGGCKCGGVNASRFTPAASRSRSAWQAAGVKWWLRRTPARSRRLARTRRPRRRAAPVNGTGGVKGGGRCEVDAPLERAGRERRAAPVNGQAGREGPAAGGGLHSAPYTSHLAAWQAGREGPAAGGERQVVALARDETGAGDDEVDVAKAPPTSYLLPPTSYLPTSYLLHTSHLPREATRSTWPRQERDMRHTSPRSVCEGRGGAA